MMKVQTLPGNTGDKKFVAPDEACLRMASLIEHELLPGAPPCIVGADIAGWTLYSHTFGGDFFDYHDFHGVCCQTDTKLRIVVGDACGHGLCSAMLMTSTRSYLRARALKQGNLVQVVSDVNRLLCMDIKTSGVFVTLFYAAIDTRERNIEWVRAGHPPALLFNPLLKEFVSLAGAGMALGVDPNFPYQTGHQTDLPEGTILLVGSDGLWEQAWEDGLPGRQTITDLVLQHRDESATSLAAAVKETVHARGDAARLQDDVTLIVVKFGAGSTRCTPST